MPKTKTVKKITKKTVKQSPTKKVIKKVAPKVSQLVSKRRSPLFRLGIVVVLTLLAVSLYQAFATGTGPLSFLAGKSEVFLVTDGGTGGGVATCNLPESVCKTVNGCKWTTPIYSEKQVSCSDAECKSGAHGCSGKNVTTSKTVEVCEDSGLSLSKCKQLGFDTIKSVQNVTSYVCNDSYTDDVLERAGGCSGTPIVPPVVTPTSPPPNAYIPTASKPPIPDYCKFACATNVDSAACKSCLANSFKACCTVEKKSPSCDVCKVPGTQNPSCKDGASIYKQPILQNKQTVVNIVSVRESCGEGTQSCTAQLKPETSKKGDSICVGGRGGGENSNLQFKYPLTADEACKSVVPAGTKYTLIDQKRYTIQLKTSCGSATAFDVWYDNTQGANMAAGCNSGNYAGCKGYARCCVMASDYNKVAADTCDQTTYKAVSTNKNTKVIEDVTKKIKDGGMKYDCSTSATSTCLTTGNYSAQLPTDIYGTVFFSVPNNGNKEYQGCSRLEGGKVKTGYCCPNILNQ